MTDNNHPITPPPELVQQWWQDPCSFEDSIKQATRWGADQELDACCKWLPKLPPWSADDLRKHRRPKPSSLKEQALEELSLISISPESGVRVSALDTIRRALEQLDD